MLAAVLVAACTSVPPTVEATIAALPDGPVEIAEDADLIERLRKVRDELDTTGRYSRIDALRDLVRTRPRLAEARLLLARALVAEIERDDGKLASELRLDLVREAEVAARAGIKYQPKSAELQTVLGRVLEADGHLEAAVEAYESAMQLGSPRLEALFGASRISIALGEERRAVVHLEQLRNGVEQIPVEALLWEARCYLTLHSTLLREGSREETDKANRKTYLGRAVRAFDALAIRTPEDARVVAGRAYCRFEQLRQRDIERTQANIEQVGNLYREAARLAPRDPRSRFDLGVFLESDLVGDTSAAIAAYRAAIDRDAQHLPSRLNLARLLWNRDDTAAKTEARSLWTRALPELQGREKKRVETLLANDASKSK